MRTDQLIAQLADYPRPAGRARLRVAGAMGAGWLIALAGLTVTHGSPLTAVAETGVAPFVVKLGYTLALACLSVIAAMAAGRPGRKLVRPILLIAAPFLVISAVAMLELASVERDAWRRMVMGSTYLSCVKAVAFASLPVLAGLLLAYRVMAPTRLAIAGFLIGLSAGAAGAVAFTLYCHEATAAFLVAAYTPAMLIPGLIGAALGPALLRW
jgi:hypothetical protein